MKRNERNEPEGSPTLALLKHYVLPLTLDEWLGLNNLNIDKPFDAELFETLPEQFHAEFTERFSNFVPGKGGIQ